MTEGLSADAVGPVVLVTGAAGYLGGFLVAHLARLGCTVRAVDVVPLPDPPAGVHGEIVDVRDVGALTAACAGVDTVFHAAAAMAFAGLVPSAVRARVMGINVDGTAAVIAACRAAGVRRLVYTSSANVVIDRELVEADETAPYAASFVDLYTASKVAAERQVLAADTPGGLRTVALRPGGIWGPGVGGYMIVTFLRQLAAGSFVATIGDGRAVVDNTYVLSLVRAELLAAAALGAETCAAGGRAYFVTDEERINGVAWFRPLVEGLGVRWPTRRLPGGLMYGVAWLAEVAHRLGAPEPPVTRIGVLKLVRSSAFRTDRARADLGYRPLVGSAEGLALHLDDYRATYAALRRG
ncbi:MAG: NAD-dependent epimerase/dehydratase family protein [Alphaproteobacteria bacterium]|nr:NAD-dependent epimerase/dehydratase family protein [Alphaproteobacteria bacterium]